MEKRNRIISTIIFIVMAAVSVAAVLRYSNGLSVEELMDSLRTADHRWTAAAFVCVAIYIVSEAMALRILLKSSGYRMRRRNTLSYSAASIYFSAITPSSSGGQPAAAILMIRDGISAGVVTATLAINVVMYTLATEVVGIAAIIIAPEIFMGFSPFSKLLIISGFLVYTGLTVFFILILKKGKMIFGTAEKLLRFLASKKIIRRLEPKLFKLTKARVEYEECVHIAGGKPKGLIRAFACNLVQRIAQIMVSACVYLALDGSVAKSVKIFCSQCLISIGYNSIPIPGAIGIADYLMIDGFSALINNDLAVKLELLSRGISFYLCVLICGVIVFAGSLISMFKKKGV